MVVRRICYPIICFLTSTVLILNFLIPIPTSRAQELSETQEEQIEKIITTFASEPELGMKLLEQLSEENPGLAVLTIVELAKRIPEKAMMAAVNLAETSPMVTAKGLVAIGRASAALAETQPQLAATLKAVLTESTVQIIEITPSIAALVVQSCNEFDPELGKSLWNETTAAGLELSYLFAASPIMP